ncbi:hypothetical protein LUZ61_005437 [Rhynchospora tenuis]|uniref:Uncharacterized protein n=1 Tax=Rhynchospora tenuis TaxID=198213 RepID=A0AAD5ZPM6_9POAL|nr:hypothetical protein LUZ61_005437 [Rhynchospora tenuis]
MKEPSIPVPLPLPPPPLETMAVHMPMRHRVRQTAASSTRTSSSNSSLLLSSPTSSSSLSSSSSSTSSSSIPFSWEHQPGIPKNPNAFEALALPLPLPPSRRTGTNTSSRSSLGTGSKPLSDPFVTALSECAKEGFECIPVGTATHSRRRSTAVGTMAVPTKITGRLGLLDLYGCKTAISVVDAAVSLPRTGRRVSTYRVISRQNRSEKR